MTEGNNYLIFTVRTRTKKSVMMHEQVQLLKQFQYKFSSSRTDKGYPTKNDLNFPKLIILIRQY